MNINNVGRIPNAEDPRTDKSGVEAGQQTSVTADTDTASGIAGDAPRKSAGTRDSFQSTADRARVRELTDMVSNMEPPVREEAVARARQRISEGYYDSREFLGGLAEKLINTGTAP